MAAAQTGFVLIACCTALSLSCAPVAHEWQDPWDAKRGSSSAARTPPADRTLDTNRAPRPGQGRIQFSWPLRGKISSGFGSARGGRHHRGIDIRVAPGTAIRAAGAGRVSFSGRMWGYGNVIILDHGDRIQTRYAHNRNNLVRKGDRVERGGVIAEVGSSGNATAPHLHFEVREDGRAQDPVHFLPSRAVPAN